MPPDALQPKAYCTNPGLQSFLLAAPGVSTRDPSSERRNYLGEKWPVIWTESCDFHAYTFGFLYMPKICDMGKKACWRFFSPWKIRRLRPGLNPRTWVPKASTLPLDHRSPFIPPYNHNVFKSSRDSLLVYAHYLYVCCCLHQPHWNILVRCGTDGCLHVINTQCLAFCFSIYIYEKILDYRNMKRNAAKLERSAGKRPLARLLPITLVRKKICDMLSGEIGNFGRIMYKITTSSEKNTSLYTIFWYIGRVRTSRLLLRLWRCFRVEWFGLHLAKGCDGIAALIPCKKKNTLWSFRHTSVGQLFYTWSKRWSWS